MRDEIQRKQAALSQINLTLLCPEISEDTRKLLRADRERLIREIGHIIVVTAQRISKEGVRFMLKANN